MMEQPFPSTPLAFCRWMALRFLPGRLLLLLVITIFATTSTATTPWVVGQLVDRLPAAIGAKDVNQVVGWFGLLLVVWLVGPVLGRVYTFVNAFTLPKLSGLVGMAIFDYTLKQPTNFFQNTFTGALTQRIRNVSRSGPDLVEYFVQQFVQVALGIAVAGFWVYQAVPAYGMAFLGFTLVFLAVSLWMALKVSVVGRALGEAQSRVTGQLADAIGSIDLVHSFGAHDYESNRLQQRIDLEVKCGKEARFWFSAMRVAQLSLTTGFMSVLVWFALQRAIAGELSVGTVVMLLTTGLQLAMSITNLGDYILNFYLKLGEVKEGLDVIATPLINQDLPNALPLNAVQGRIECQSLFFGYNGLKPVFNGFDISIAAGEKVGLVGPSGAGKSTLFKLLTRRYPLSDGRVLIDGQDLTQLQRETVARQVAEVTQTAELFHRSIKENIRYGRPNATDDEVVAAASAAQCDVFVLALPKGYDTLVGERGVKLSGGERQRIAIARAILKDAPILLLDEATSALDSESEAAIQRALTQLMQGRTVIAIAHRLSTVVSMDRILYMENGHLVESGRHESLLAHQGGYARLWERQVAGYNSSSVINKKADVSMHK